MPKGNRWEFGTVLRSLIVIAVAVTLNIGFYGCDKEKPTFSQKRVKIGVIIPLTGPDSSTGEDIKAGIELAVDVVNESFDLPVPLAKTTGLRSHGNAKFEIVYRDSKSDPEEAFKEVENLVKEDKVIAIMGDYRSNVTARAGQQAEIMGIPFLNSLSTSPLLTKQGLKWFFRVTPDDEIFAQNFFTFLSDLSKQSRITIPKHIILVYENKLFGTSVSHAEKKLAAGNGYRIASDVPYNPETGNVDAELKRIRSALPGIILQTSYLNDAVLFMRGYKKGNINAKAIIAMNAGFISPEFIKILGPDAEYVMSREVWAHDLAKKKPLAGTVNDLFSKRFKRDMEGNSARAFTGLIVLADAINRSESLKAEDIRKSLLQTDIKSEEIIMPWDGVKFDPATGQNILGKGIIVQIQQGKYHTVWPWTAAAKPVIWPMPSWSERRND
ncbi:MAG: ABC transporter substrate-binding protein [Syntrophales bacterium]|jgi:branched-chain amino acid transport system substrate-binding protein